MARLVFILVIFMFLAGKEISLGQTKASLSDFLTQGEGVAILIEDINETGQKIGITKEKLQKICHDELRLNKISVLSNQDRARTAKKAYIYVNVSFSEIDDGWVAFTIRMEHRQLAWLNPQKYFFATTWEQQTTGLVDLRIGGTAELTTKILKQMVNMFSDDYYKAPGNGKRPSTAPPPKPPK